MVLQSLQIGAVSVSNRQSTSVQAAVVMVLVVAARKSTFSFFSLALCLLPSQSLSDQSDSWVEGCRADFAIEWTWQSPSLACPGSRCYCGVGISAHLGAGRGRNDIGGCGHCCFGRRQWGQQVH